MYSLCRTDTIKLRKYFLLIDCRLKNLLVAFIMSIFNPSLTSHFFAIVGLIQNWLLHFAAILFHSFGKNFEGYRLKNHGGVLKIVTIPDSKCTVVEIT